MQDINNTRELSQIEKKRLANRLSYQRNRENRIAATKRNYINNNLYEKNKEKYKKISKNWYKINKYKYCEKQRAIYKLNKEKIKKRVYSYHKRKLKTDSNYAAKVKIRNAVSNSFRRIKVNKPTNTTRLLGCSWKDAKAHIESQFIEGMSWSNHGMWHIDHIKPVCTFKANELHLMNRISNLRPLWATDNQKRPRDGRDVK